MYSINILCSWFLLISTVSTLAIKPSQTLINLLPGPSSTADAQVNGQANVTLGWSSNDGSNDLKIDCSAARYGRGLRYSSCANAISSFVQPFTGWVTIGPREDNQAYNYYLPWRWISDDGRCIIDIISQQAGMALPTQLTSAATALLEQCVRHGIGLGGMVTGVGWNGKFALAMRPFDPSAIVCEDKTADPPFEDDCDDMVQTMPAGLYDHETFGPAGAPGVTAALPFHYITHPPKGCALAINRMPNLHASTVDSDLWYDIWGYAVAIQGMCVRHGREGSLISAGDHEDLIVWLLEYHGGEAIVLGNATLGTMPANNTKTLSTNLEMPLPIQTVSSS